MLSKSSRQLRLWRLLVFPPVVLEPVLWRVIREREHGSNARRGFDEYLSKDSLQRLGPKTQQHIRDGRVKEFNVTAFAAILVGDRPLLPKGGEPWNVVHEIRKLRNGIVHDRQDRGLTKASSATSGGTRWTIYESWREVCRQLNCQEAGGYNQVPYELNKKQCRYCTKSKSPTSGSFA